MYRATSLLSLIWCFSRQTLYGVGSRLWGHYRVLYFPTIRRCLYMVVLLVTAMFTASAQKTSDKTAMEEERRKLQLELRQIQAAYDAVKGQSTNALHQLAALNKKIELQERYINNISKEIRLINDDIYYSSLEINRLKKQMDTLKSHYARTVVYAYKNRSNYDYLYFIVS